MQEPTEPKPCEAFTYLPLQLRIEILKAHPSADWGLVLAHLTCALAAHEGAEHHAVAYDHFPGPDAGALWTRWTDGNPPESFHLLPDCPTPSPHGTACGHFTTHPGPHTWE